MRPPNDDLRLCVIMAFRVSISKDWYPFAQTCRNIGWVNHKLKLGKSCFKDIFDAISLQKIRKDFYLFE